MLLLQYSVSLQIEELNNENYDELSKYINNYFKIILDNTENANNILPYLKELNENNYKEILCNLCKISIKSTSYILFFTNTYFLNLLTLSLHCHFHLFLYNLNFV